MRSHRFPLLVGACLMLLPFICTPGADGQLIQQSLNDLEAAPPISPDSFDFIVTADSNSLQPLVQSEVFRQFIREFNVWQPNFVVEAGDIILGGAAEGLPPQWDLFEEVIADLEVPFFPLPGNHDITDQASEELWLERMGPTYYSFTYGNSLFILLNSEAQDAVNSISESQRAWVKDILEASTAKHIFVFLHRPYFSYEGDPAQAAPKWEKQWANMAALFKGHPVRVVFAGHWHGYQDCGTREGVRYIITGGASVYGLNHPDEEGGFNHYLHVRVRGEEINWSVIRPNAVLPEDCVTLARMDELYNIRNNWIAAEELVVPLGDAVDAPLTISIENPHDEAMASTLSWEEQPGWTVTPKEKAYEVPGKGSVELTFQVASEDPLFPVPYFTTLYEQTQHGPAVQVKQDLKLIPSAKVVKAEAPVTLDGVLDEWQDAQMVRLIYPAHFDGVDKDDLDAELGFMWDENWLYLAVRTQDNEYHQPYAGDIVWSADNVETFLNDWSWGFSLIQGGPEVFLYRGVGTSGQEINTDAKLMVKREGTKMFYEAAIPSTHMSPLLLAPGNSFRFNTLMNDIDPNGPVEGRHWLQLVPEYAKEGGPKPKMMFVLQD